MNSLSENNCKAIAATFILQNKAWVKYSDGAVHFAYNLNTYILKLLIVEPGMNEENQWLELSPKIKQNGSRSYVFHAQKVKQLKKVHKTLHTYHLNIILISIQNKIGC